MPWLSSDRKRIGMAIPGSATHSESKGLYGIARTLNSVPVRRHSSAEFCNGTAWLSKTMRRHSNDKLGEGFARQGRAKA